MLSCSNNLRDVRTTVLVVMTSQNWDPSHLVVGTLATEAGGGEHLPQVSDRAGGVT